jgi:mono/diheme cytochrome c family protein
MLPPRFHPLFYPARAAFYALVFCTLQGAQSARSADAGTAQPAAPGPRPLTFERDIRPILKHHCVHCHGEGEKLKGGLDVRLRRFLVAPHGEDGAVAVVPGDPGKSELWNLVRDGEMPPKGKKLNEREVATIREWIAQGAVTARAEPEQVPTVYLTEEDREYWAFQPIRRPPVPAPAAASSSPHPVDRFVSAGLARHGFSLNGEADRATLLRRVAFDLTGLMPTPEQVQEFEADSAPDAYARMVERFLASPHFGERWARHWLDVAGYADSDGYSDADTVRPWAYQYRDYVIRSLNADKPFDRFLQEQLAGDERVTSPRDNLSAADKEHLAATGFLRMAPDGTATAPAAEQTTARNAVIAETLKVVSTSLLGMSVGCAQCHDHKHDPIPQRDYYRLRAVFEPGFDTGRWRAPAARQLSLMSAAERARAAEIEAEAKAIDERRKKREAELIELVLGWELNSKPEELREPLREAFQTPAAKRNPAQLKLLKEHPTINQLNGSSLYLYDRTYNTQHEAELKKIADEAAAVRKRKPAEVFLPVFNESAESIKDPPKTRVFQRGDPQQPREAVEPGEFTVLEALQPASFTPATPPPAGTGRRSEYARYLTSGSHPLVGRVLVNRVWHHVMGRGIVATPADFGRQGEAPSHPELLDWLASEFTGDGWRLKSLLRLLLNSATYKQSSARTPLKDAADPENRLFGRALVRRMDAESLRDSMLLLSGKLNPKMFGAPVPVMLDLSGQVVVGVDTADTAGRPTGKVVPLNGEEFRRSIYVQARRTRPLGMLETFDLPKMEPNCEARSASTVAPQALSLMNSEFALEQSRFLAERVGREPDRENQIRAAWSLILGRQPSAEETRRALDFLTAQTATLQTSAGRAGSPPAAPVSAPVRAPAAPQAAPKTASKAPASPAPATPLPPEVAALATLCQALLSSNGFLYVD